jgi:hypothetical protein
VGASVAVASFASVRSKSAWAIIVGLLAGGVLSACAVVDRVDPRYDNINRAAANARNEGIFLNIVRASRNVPLNFITFSKVSGSGALNSSAGLPTFGIGPQPFNLVSQRQVLVDSHVLSGGVRIDNSFDISLLESKDFYNGLLAPVDLPTLNFFVRQEYPRGLLFWLFAGSVRETIAGRTYEYRNDPDPSIACDEVRGRQRCFSDMVDIAIASGLTVQIKTVTAGKGGTVHGRLCFDNVLASRVKRQYPPDLFSALFSTSPHRPLCSDPWPRSMDGATDILVFHVSGTPVGTIRYEIVTRSIYGIYQFLGRILATGTTEQIRLRERLHETEDTRLLAISGSSLSGCFVDQILDSAYYCVPQEGAENTKRIFSLLAQLLALKTAPGDLAITPTVRTIQ